MYQFVMAFRLYQLTRFSDMLLKDDGNMKQKQSTSADRVNVIQNFSPACTQR